MKDASIKANLYRSGNVWNPLMYFVICSSEHWMKDAAIINKHFRHEKTENPEKDTSQRLHSKYYDVTTVTEVSLRKSRRTLNYSIPDTPYSVMALQSF